jgi:hypothetical protein
VIGPDRLARATAQAVVPEQVVPYALAVGDGAPRWFGACIGYQTGDHAVVVGYPLHDPLDRSAMAEAVDLAMDSPEVRRITVLAPTRPPQAPPHALFAEDGYYGLELPLGPPRQKLRNLLRRAQREVKIDRGRTLEHAHDAIVKRYMAERSLAPGTRRIYSRLHRYLDASPGVLIFSARHGDGRLAAFAVGEFGALSSAFFMFCFRDPLSAPPGSADLALSALIREAEARGHQRVNLGLGVNEGIRFFKHKWSAELFLPHVEVSWNL